MEDQAKYGNPPSSKQPGKYDVAINVLQDELNSARADLRKALMYIEQKKDGRAEWYQEIAIDLQQNIRQLEDAIVKLST